jgi:chemotaxis protein methyltransferase CheR
VDFDYLRHLVHKRSAIVLEAEKLYLAETRLQLLARREGCASVCELIARLRVHPFSGLHQKVVEAMTTNETSFFRDIQPFEALRQLVIPQLLQRRMNERRLTIWCAASSTGQEAYSVAMLVCHHFPSLKGWDVRILASDFSSEVLERAQQGRYSQVEVNRGLPAEMLVRYFQRQGMDWQIQDEIRALVEFRQLNLSEPWPPLPLMDIVFLRNVLIYFDIPTKKDILGKVRRLLYPDGYLFLGGAETTLNLDDAYQRVDFERSGCYRLRKA